MALSKKRLELGPFISIALETLPMLPFATEYYAGICIQYRITGGMPHEIKRNTS